LFVAAYYFSGVGYGIALRYIRELSGCHSYDIDRGSGVVPANVESPFTTPNGLSLILACRNIKKAREACDSLLEAAGKTRESGAETKERIGNGAGGKAGGRMSKEEYTKRWLEGLEIEYVPLDLASVESVLECADKVKER
jgi:3-keto steroid reductase